MKRRWSVLILVMTLTASLLILWFTNTGLDELQGSRETYTALASPGRNVSGLSYDGSSLWVTVDGAETIYQVEPESWQVKRQIAFPVKATGGSAVGSSRVDLQACKLEYSIVSPK